MDPAYSVLAYGVKELSLSQALYPFSLRQHAGFLEFQRYVKPVLH